MSTATAETSVLPIDWNEITEHATKLLGDYIRINTTNPPGGEEAGAVFLREALKREGIESKFYDAGSGRVSMSARVPATVNRGNKPIVLLSHIDVVPVEPEHWKMDPFSGAVVENAIWGRGALDMKGMGVMELLTMVLAKRHAIPLDRDLVFVAVADEEEGGIYGVHHLAEHHADILESDYVFNEGAYGFCEFMGREAKIVGIAPSEKSPCWLKLKAKGMPGHASVPHSKNALVKLVKALARVEAAERRIVLTPAVEAMLRTLAQKGFLPADLDPRDEGVLTMLTSMDAHLSAITHDTCSITSVHAGQKINVIPAGAEATVDCRLLPTTDPLEFVAEIRRVVDDPDVEVEIVYQHDSGMSSMDTPVVSIAAQVIREKLGEDAFLMPQLSPGFTDSHAYRAAGGQAYGFTPALLTREELTTIHGHNERISVANLRLGTEVLFEVVRRLASHG
ncbi:MAG TPA: M20/M25/M40 family metallo-hydrolase [Candidatus Limnocylindrales bacterium]|nr:M20/M25/M40 family metallo-hydrolase [Candidatus Limnocylindrales bacterium]